ncbi:MAG: aspartate--tRNA(Asn) ligase [Bacillota bacterium]
MKIIMGKTEKILSGAELLRKIGTTVRIPGMVHKVREMGGFAFIVLRTGNGLCQCVYAAEKARFKLEDVPEGAAVVFEGEVKKEERAAAGFELHLTGAEVLSKPAAGLPLVVNKKKLDASLDSSLFYRPLALRNPRERAIFRIQEGLVRGFREYLFEQGFTEIRTPKIVSAGAEGGANIFKIDYFGREAYLAQSPQFYKQMMVGVFQRVFEAGPVYRAEKHNTARHLNEYVSMDYEMGFIRDFTDVMEMETGLMRFLFTFLKEEYGSELEMLETELPSIEGIPAMKFIEAKKILREIYGKKKSDPYDFDPLEEQLICRYARENFCAEFIFITHYPEKKRPFYAMDDPSEPGYTKSFDLLFRGLEITTGGQRIHDYQMQVEKMIKKGLNPSNFESYLMIHKYGMPPHGGLGIGLERLTMRLLGLQNIRQACLFPRDTGRLTP